MFSEKRSSGPFYLKKSNNFFTFSKDRNSGPFYRKKVTLVLYSLKIEILGHHNV